MAAMTHNKILKIWECKRDNSMILIGPYVATISVQIFFVQVYVE